MDYSTPADEVKKQLDIVQIVSETVTLKRSGANYTGFCPFHANSKTPALAVFPETKTWKCFGSCGDGGDVISWVMKRDGLDFKAALEKLSVNGTGSQPAQSKKTFTSLADYAAAHGVTAEVFSAAGWAQTTQHNRPALAFKTSNGPRYRFLDGADPRYWHKAGYKRCWYGLQQAVSLANGRPLVICNGEASTVVAQSFGVAAVAIAGGSEKPTLPANLLTQLQAAYSGPIVVAFDCDEAGRTNAPKVAAQLKAAGSPARAVDLALGIAGGDLADFCKLHATQAAAALQKLAELEPPKIKEPEVKIKSADYLDALRSIGYSFRLNVLDDTIEVNQEPLTDIAYAQIRSRMRDIGFVKNLGAMEDAYTAGAASQPYHPVKHYLQSLKYDGLPHIDILASYFRDSQGVFKVWLKKWLVGTTAKVFEAVQNPMLVLDGAQNKGKSHFAAWLCPLPQHFVESPIQPDNNDHKILLATTWLWEVSELGATTRKADREALKSFITLKHITARKPYGKRPINKPAMSSFIGTVNNEAGFLNDPTGSRRFLTCTLTRIDWDYTAINVNDVWAEAYHLYQSGYNWRLTAQEQKLQYEINEEYEVIDPWAETILKHYQITGCADDWQPSRDFLEKLQVDPNEQRNTMRLARVMKKLESQGVLKLKQGPNTNRINGYSGLKMMMNPSV